MRLRIALAMWLAACLLAAGPECVAACLGVAGAVPAAPPCHRHSSHEGPGSQPCVHAKLVALTPDSFSLGVAAPIPDLSLVSPRQVEFAPAWIEASPRADAGSLVLRI